MKVTIKDNSILVFQDEGERFKNESHFLHHLKLHLNEHHGMDLIKKRMAKDGHTVDDFQQYLRSRKRTAKPCEAIYSGFWAIEDANARLHRIGSVVLTRTDLSALTDLSEA